MRRIPRVDFVRQLRPWPRNLPRPCGILAVNDETASVVAVACSMDGLAIPDDIAIIGIDDDPVICRGLLHETHYSNSFGRHLKN